MFGEATMAFGKRQSHVGTPAQALSLDMTAATATDHVTAEAARPAGTPFRWLVLVLLCGAGLYWLFSTYGSGILRDQRLAGTWQPAYDLRAGDGKCKRYNFVVTFCSARIKSVARPDQPAIELDFLMLFAGGKGEAMVPVRSTTDRTAVSIHYAAETRLWNRTLSFMAVAGLMALFGIAGLFACARTADS